MQKNAGALQNIIQSTMEEVAPQVEKLEKSMKQLRLEDSKAIGAQVAKMEKSELRQTVQNQMQEVQMTLGQGYGQVMQGMQQASRKVSRAQRKYMNDMNNMQRKDYRADRKIMRDLSRQANKGMRIARRNFDMLARQAMQEYTKQVRETQQNF